MPPLTVAANMCEGSLGSMAKSSTPPEEASSGSAATASVIGWEPCSSQCNSRQVDRQQPAVFQHLQQQASRTAMTQLTARMTQVLPRDAPARSLIGLSKTRLLSKDHELLLPVTCIRLNGLKNNCEISRSPVVTVQENRLISGSGGGPRPPCLLFLRDRIKEIA